MTLPTPYTVTREPFDEGATDAYGDPVEGWGPSVLVDVHGWSPPSADGEPAIAGRDAVVRDLDLYAPAGTTSAPGDRWTLNGVQYLAVGHPEDYTTGPWSSDVAGVRINLKRVEG